MSRFAVSDTRLAGLRVIERRPVSDSRGFLTRMFCAQELESAGWSKPVAQINHTLTRKAGAVRGMHFQRAPHADRKLVTCLRGSVWDVAIDLRAGSTTFLTWHAELLSGDNLKALLIPEGFAHGFQALTDDCELLYLHSAAYAPESDCGLNPLDPVLSINWPLAITELSPRDAGHPSIDREFAGLD